METEDKTKNTSADNAEYLRQGPATNLLTKTISGKSNTRFDTVNSTATISNGNLSVKLLDKSMVSGLRVSVHLLLDALTLVFTRTGAKSKQIRLPLSEYARLRGLHNIKELRKQVLSDLATLYDMRLSYTDSADKEKSFSDVKICDTPGEVKNGIIIFVFSDEFFSLLKSCLIMPVLPQLWTVNANKNPNSYFLLRKLLEHKNMNRSKTNENRISVKSLLDVCANIPSFDTVMSSSRDVSRRIITPFERDLNALAPALKWHYAYRFGGELTEEDIRDMNYSLFAECIIVVDWINYPDRDVKPKAVKDVTVLQERGKHSAKRVV